MDKTKKLVLTIEDQPAIADLLGFLLDATELEVKRSDNGAEGLEMIKKLRPDLVIMDVMMPVMDGWQVFDAVRHHEATQNIPIIMLSVARQEPERRVAFRGSHLDFYMTKPFDVASLRRMVQEILGIEIWIKSAPISSPTPPESSVKATQPIQPPSPATPSPTMPSAPTPEPTASSTVPTSSAPSESSGPSAAPTPPTTPTLPPEPAVPSTPPTDAAASSVPATPPETPPPVPSTPPTPSEPSAPPQVKE